jgi:hypothetical protein
MPPVGNLPQLPLVARRPVRAYGMPPVGNLPPVVPTTNAPGQRRKSDVPLWESTPSSAYDRLAEVNDARAMSRSGNLLPGSACDQTRRG